MIERSNSAPGDGTIQPESKQPHVLDRFLIGTVLLVAGLALHTGLVGIALIAHRGPRGLDLGAAIGMFAFGVVANLFLLLGCEKVVGPKRWIERLKSRGALQLTVWCVLVQVTIVVVVVLVL